MLLKYGVKIEDSVKIQEKILYYPRIILAFCG
jgi:hypothetical protein